MSTPVPASIGAAGGALLWTSTSATMDEALNQREFEAARQQWLQSDQKKPTGAKASAPTGKAQPATQQAKTKAHLTKKVLDRADLLMAESARMDARLALLRQSMSEQKARRTTATKAPLAATLRAGGGVNYKNVAPRVETQNVFLNVKHQAEREARDSAAKEARAQAEEARKHAELKAKGHTLVTYAPAEERHTWVLHRDEEEAPMAVAQAIGLSVRGAQPIPRRKQVTAADMMRTKRESVTNGSVKPTAAASAASAVASTPVTSTGPSSSSVIDRTRFNLVSQPQPTPSPNTAASSTTIASSTASTATFHSNWGDDLDEERNAAEFAAAREEWLKSIQPAESTSALATAPVSQSSATFEPQAEVPASAAPSSFLAASAALPSNWWEQDEAASANAKPGSLLDGPGFDERDSAGAFQAAREKWLAENSAAVSAPLANVTSAPVAASVTAPTPRPSSISPSAVTSTVAAPQPPAAAEPAAAKISCYTCYKLFFAASSVVDPETSKSFCTEACAAAARAERKESCAVCAKKVQRKNARSQADSTWICLPCSSRAAPPAVAAPSSAASIAPPQEELISLFAGGDEDFSFVMQALQPIQPIAAASVAATSAAASAPPSHTPTPRKPIVPMTDESGSISAWD